MNNRLRVRGANHALIGFDIAVPEGAELVVEHQHFRQLLARECRPLVAGTSRVALKTHPRASHVACSLRVGDKPFDAGGFTVECGSPIEPVGRYFMVIGAMKAGTTTLFELLARHPALCRTWAELPGVSFTKEINYFRRLHRAGHTPIHYDWRFPFDAGRHAWTLDVSPGYAKWPGSRGVPARIASLGGETKLAYILREPVDRIESHLAHTLRHGGETSNLQHCIRTSCYAWQLDKFMAHITRDDVLLLDFEELQQEPDAILAKICDFLGIEHITCHSEAHNTRSIDFALDPGQRAELADAVRSDIQRLIDVYGFTPAEKWLRDAR